MGERLQPDQCIQLTEKNYSCAGCPIYSLAQEIISGGMDGKTMVLQLTTRCPEGAQMNLKGLGISVEENIKPIHAEREPYFVR